jgi:hypothetical protein
MRTVLHVKQIRSVSNYFEFVLFGLRSSTGKYQTQDGGAIANGPNDANTRVLLQHHRDPCQGV